MAEDPSSSDQSREFTDLMDAIPGSYDRLLEARRDIAAGRTFPLRDLVSRGEPTREVPAPTHAEEDG